MTVSNLTISDRLFYCKCVGCNFYNLDPRNLVHFANNDHSLLTKHRKRAHAYILRLRAPSKDAGTFELVYYNTTPSPDSTSASATTSDATSRAMKAERAREQITAMNKRRLTSSLPRPFVTDNEYERANATGPVSLPPVSQTPRLSRLTKNVAPNGEGHAEPLDWLQQHVDRSRFLGHMDRLTFVLTPPNPNGQHSARGPVRRLRL